MKKSLLAILFAIPALLPTKLNAQWTSNPTLNTVICSVIGDETVPDIISDGAGGAIITWSDYRNGINQDIYAQHLNALGVATWTTNGVAICTASDEQYYPKIISDGAGGAVITWQDYRNGAGTDIYAQRINALGVVQWGTNGTPICLATSGQYTSNNYYSPTLLPDGTGGAIITWFDLRNGVSYDIYAQKINGLGIVQWTTDGVNICPTAGEQELPVVSPDGSGGVIVAWYDIRNGNWDIYAQRVNSSGVIQWNAAGVPICTATGEQAYQTIAPDNSGGAIITWHDYRAGATDIYAQHIDAAGTVLWTTDGVVICAASSYQYNPNILEDGSGGAIITWHDVRTPGNYDIYAQRINGAGAVQWTADGVAVTSNTDNQQSPVITSDSMGGAIITWYDNISDIYAQRLNSSGVLQWAPNGVAISTAGGPQVYPDIIADGSGGAIITWADLRISNYDIYAQNIDSYGGLGVTTGINEDNSSAGITLYPNPANSFLNIAINENMIANTALIYDVNGKAVKTLSLTNTDKNFQTDISSLTPGIYLFVIQSDNLNYSKTFIVE
jgi:hypothetical protein